MGVFYNPNWNAGTAGSGGGVYGTVPNPTLLPNRTADLTATGLPVGQINQLMSQNILDDLSGNVSYDPSIQFAANTGLRSGLMGSDFARRAGAADYLSRVEQAKQRGQNNALNTINTTSGTQTISPETQIGLDQQNQQLAAAPDPAAAATAALSGYQNALNRAQSYYQQPRQPQGGGGGGGFFNTQSRGGSGYAPVQSYSGTATSPVTYSGGSNFGGYGGMAGTGSGGGSSMNVGGYDVYDPSYYDQLFAEQNPELADYTDEDWALFE